MLQRRSNTFNVCFLASNIPFNAPTAGFSHTLNVCKNLQRSGDNVLIIFGGEKERLFRYGNLKIMTVRGWEHEGAFSLKSLLFTPVAILKLTRICIQNNIDLIHERSGLPRGIGILAAKILGIRSVVELNDPYLEELNIKHGFFLRMFRIFMLLLTSKVLTQTPLLKSIISNDIHPGKIVIIPNGADMDEFLPSIDGSRIRNLYSLKKTDVVVIFIGAFQPWHGVDKIPYFAEELKVTFPNVRFLVIGNGSFFEAVQQDIKKKKLEKTVILTGSIPHHQIPEYLAAADIAIAPFNTDTYPVLKKHGFWWCPVKLFEYLAMEKPVITTNEGMNKFIVPDGVAGFLSSPQRYDEFLEKLKILANDKNLRQSLGKNGRKIILEKYSWQVIGQRIHKMYMKL